MSVDVSILCPTIRTHLLPAFYESAEKACTNHTFEVVFVSPFEKPQYFDDKNNVRWIEDCGCPSRATQIGALACEGEYIYNCVDDGIFTEGCIDKAINYFNDNCTPLDIINMRYRESENRSKTDEFPDSYWCVWGIPNLSALVGVNNEWKIALHFFMRREFYLELGGVDGSFEYVNHGAHDLVFRAQARGAVVHLSPCEGLMCTHVPERTGDHAPIHDAQLSHDEPLFNEIYSKEGVASTRVIDLYNWTECPSVWARRFGQDQPPKKYEDLPKAHGSSSAFWNTKSKVDLSIILPGIRPQNWGNLYSSIEKACSRSWELIICGPVKHFPEELEHAENVKIIYDKGSPVRASNIAATLASGRYITWAADDGVYMPQSIDAALDCLEEMGHGDHNVVVGKYYEGQQGDHKPLQDDTYFKINGAACTRSPHINDDWYLFNVAFMHTAFFNSLGGWNVEYEACPMAHTDFACRAYQEAAKVKMCEVPILDCSHMPGTSGDHGPIHHAQLEHDEPLFRERYADPNWKTKRRNLAYQIPSWKAYPSVWERRFKND
jgi:hypothetical protein